MKRSLLSIAGLMAILIVCAVVYRAAPDHRTGENSEFVVNAPASEHNSLKQVDFEACRSEVLAGQDLAVRASQSRVERQRLAQETGVVARYCMCKFAGAEKITTKREMVTQWLSASKLVSSEPKCESCAKLDQIAENCAQKYGLGG